MSSAFLSSGCWIALNHYFCHLVLNKIYSVNNIIGMKGIAIKLIIKPQNIICLGADLIWLQTALIWIIGNQTIINHLQL